MQNNNNTNKRNCHESCVCIDCIVIHRKNECDYGKPCGPEDWEECCECDDINKKKKEIRE